MLGLRLALMGAALLLLSGRALANPLELVSSRLPGSALRNELLRLDQLEDSSQARLELGYRQSKIYEEFEDGLLSGRLRWQGPYLRLALPAGNWYTELAAAGAEVKLGYRDHDQLDRLAGPRQMYAATLARRFKLGRGEGRVALRYATDELDAGGELPSLVSEIAGFEHDASATAGWRENQTAVDVSYSRAGSTLGAVYSAGGSAYRIAAATPGDTVLVAPQLSGETKLVYARLGESGQAQAALVFGSRSYSGDGGIWHAQERIGPAHSSQECHFAGVSYLPVNKSIASIELSNIKSKAAFSGSASLASFEGGVFGLFSARGHLAAASMLSLQSLSVRTKPRQWRRLALGYELGLSHYSLDATTTTYGTMVFGGVKVQERERELRRRGWLGHARIELDYQLNQAAALRLEVAQSLPFGSRDLVEHGPPGPPGPEVANRVDGGREISLSVVYRF